VVDKGKNLHHIFILLATSLTQLYAQPLDTLWTKTYGGIDYDYGLCAQQTFDGGYIITGLTYSFAAGACDVYLIKTDENGDTIWTKTYGGVLDDGGQSVQQTLDSGYVVVGVADGTAVTGMLYLIKTDHFGDSVWTRKFGGGGKEEGYSVQQTFDGGYVATGYTMTFGPGYSAFYLVKTDSLGDSLWTKTYGGDNWEFCFSIQQTNDSGYIMCGFTTSFGAGAQDVYLVKTDSQGDTLWTKTYGGTGDDLGYAVIQTTDGGYAISGYTSSYGAGGIDVYLIKTNSQGDTLWTRTYGGVQNDAGSSLYEAVDGGYIIVGETRSFGSGSLDAYILRTDENGDTLWTRIYGGTEPDWCSSVQQLTDFGYIIVGSTHSFGTDSSSVWLLKTEPDTLSIEEHRVTDPNWFFLKTHPNPCHEELQIRYVLTKNVIVSILMYDITGKLVRCLCSNTQTPGHYEKTFNLTDLPQGVYFVRLNTEEHAETRKIVVLR